MQFFQLSKISTKNNVFYTDPDNKKCLLSSKSAY